jgi:hypothetical protein
MTHSSRMVFLVLCGVIPAALGWSRVANDRRPEVS